MEVNVEEEAEQIEATAVKEGQGRPKVMVAKSKPMARMSLLIIDPKAHFPGGRVMTEEEQIELRRRQELKRKFEAAVEKIDDEVNKPSEGKESGEGKKKKRKRRRKKEREKGKEGKEG